jgi:hypothetical protein
MKKLIEIIALVFVLQACGSDNSELQNASDLKSDISEAGLCTKDINEHGNPSSCECTSGFEYLETAGSCIQKNRIQKNLSWTMDSDSIQSKLFHGIQDNQNGMKEIFTPLVSVSSENNLISCEANTPGMISVVQYRCAFSLDSLRLKESSNEASVQAKLFHIVKQLDPKEMINGLVSINDVIGNRIACQAKTSGLTQVVEYSCTLSFADEISIER